MNLWTSPSGTVLRTVDERRYVQIELPLASTVPSTVDIISGTVPSGMRLEGTAVVGTPSEVALETVYTAVYRATYNNTFQDRTFDIVVSGADEPKWLTDEGLLPVAQNNLLFILDNEPVDFQLEVTDSDIVAGDKLTFTLEPKQGQLPPGLQLTADGRIVGFVEPTPDLTTITPNGGYGGVYSSTPFDVGSFNYQAYNFDTIVPKTLNRYYPFSVTVSDNSTTITRSFKIYVVGDDFLRADNTGLTVANGMFTADNTYIRTPIWLTPSNLGTQRASNYITLFLDTLLPDAIAGKALYELLPQNPDGSASVLPVALALDTQTGELSGQLPAQAATSIDYKFTIRAHRVEKRINTVVVTSSFYQDTIAGSKTLKLFKLPDSTADGVDDLRVLTGRDISINNRPYKITTVSDANDDYDTIVLNRPLEAKYSVIVKSTASAVTTRVYVQTLPQSVREQLVGRQLELWSNDFYTITAIVPTVTWQISSTEPLAIQGSSLPTLEQQIVDKYTLNGILPEIISINSNTVKFVAVKTSKTLLAEMQAAFGYSAEYTLVDNSTDCVILDRGLGYPVSVGRDIGLGAYRTQPFVESIILDPAATSTSAAYRDRTFTLSVIGEIERELQWITGANLGTLRPGINSLLQVEARATAPNSTIEYSVSAGQLPPGIRLTTNGSLIGAVAASELFTLDDSTTLLDNNSTTVDRVFNFSVSAANRATDSNSVREFYIIVDTQDVVQYLDIVAVPLMKPEHRQLFSAAVSDPAVVLPSVLYRVTDPAFGIQQQLRVLIYAGIEQAEAAEFIAAIARNHRRKRLVAGEVKYAVAKFPGTTEPVYEVVYLELVDRYAGAATNPLTVKTSQTLSVDNAADQNNTPANAPYAFRSVNDAVRVDSTAVAASDNLDQTRYISSIAAMRDRIKGTGTSDKEFLPLWMQTAQSVGQSELGYTIAAPLCYCLPGTASEVVRRINASGVDLRSLDIEIDRYTVALHGKEQYLLFGNSRFNV